MRFNHFAIFPQVKNWPTVMASWLVLQETEHHFPQKPVFAQRPAVRADFPPPPHFDGLVMADRECVTEADNYFVPNLQSQLFLTKK